MPRHHGQAIRAVTFDVGGTLIEPWPSVGHVYAAVAAEHGFPGLNPHDLTRRFAAAWKAQADFGYTRAAWAGVVDETFGGLLPQPPSEISLFDAIYRRFDEPRAWRVFDDVVPTLKILLDRGLKLGLISNWDDRLRPLLKRLDLSPCFRTLTISCEVGATKPARPIFNAATLELNEPPGCILHVGDDKVADVEGAGNAGFSAVWLNRNGDHHSQDCIPRLTALPEMLFRRWGAMRY